MTRRKIRKGSPPRNVQSEWGKSFSAIFDRHISKTVHFRHKVKVYRTVIGNHTLLSIGVTFDVLEWPVTRISSVARFSWSNLGDGRNCCHSVLTLVLKSASKFATRDNMLISSYCDGISCSYVFDCSSSWFSCFVVTPQNLESLISHNGIATRLKCVFNVE